MSKLRYLLVAMFRNKFRFNGGTSKGKKVATLILFGFSYAIVLAILMLLTWQVAPALVAQGMSSLFYLFMLTSGAGIVLVFGIIYLVSTLYLAKDTDFYSTLPVKNTTVFAAKVLFVYLTETVLVYAVILPVMIQFGILAEMWFGYYIISILMLAVVPALPLSLAAIFAVPVMYLASKLKNRNIVAIIFYCVLFGGFFASYFAMFIGLNGGGSTDIDVNAMAKVLEVLSYIFYPFTALAVAAVKLPTYGLSSAASVVVNLVIFVGISAALFSVLLLLGKFMYAQSAKANNQTDNSKAKKGEFKASSAIKALIKREYTVAMRTTSTAFQCYVVIILPVIIAVVMTIMMQSMLNRTPTGDLPPDGAAIMRVFFAVLVLSTVLTVLASSANAAASTFSREGKSMASLKTLPLNIKTVLKGKIAAWCLLTLPVAVIAMVIPNIVFWDALQFVLSAVAAVCYMFCFVAFGALWDLGSPKLNWTDPKDAIKHNTHVMAGQFICMAPGFVGMLTVIIMMSVNAAFSLTTLMAVVWSITYILLAAFVVATVLLYRRAEKNYNRIEI